MATSAQKRAVKEMPKREISLEELGQRFAAQNDFVIVIPIETRISDMLEQPDQYKEQPWARVVSVGQGRMIGGVLVPIEAKPGDVVRITKYGEDITLAGVKCQLIHAAEVKIIDRKP